MQGVRSLLGKRRGWQWPTVQVAAALAVLGVVLWMTDSPPVVRADRTVPVSATVVNPRNAQEVTIGGDVHVSVLGVGGIDGTFRFRVRLDAPDLAARGSADGAAYRVVEAPGVGNTTVSAPSHVTAPIGLTVTKGYRAVAPSGEESFPVLASVRFRVESGGYDKTVATIEGVDLKAQ